MGRAASCQCIQICVCIPSHHSIRSPAQLEYQRRRYWPDRNIPLPRVAGSGVLQLLLQLLLGHSQGLGSQSLLIFSCLAYARIWPAAENLFPFEGDLLLRHNHRLAAEMYLESEIESAFGSFCGFREWYLPHGVLGGG